MNSGAPRSFRLRHLSIMLGLVFAGFSLDSAAADSPPGPDSADSSPILGEVVVSATRIETPADSVAATVTTVDRRAIDRRLPQDESALLQNEPDVVISRDLRRFGSSSINIRGIEGNRVLQMVDGVRLPDAYFAVSSNNNTTATSDSPELDFLKRVEILRGPASSLYGSDAIGGVVSYMTLDPQDILGGRSVGARYKGTWRQMDESFQHTAYVAAGSDTVEGLFAVTRRDGHEVNNKGEVGGTGFYRELPNPQDTRSDGILAKLVFKPLVGHRFRLTYENRQTDNAVDSLRISTSTPKLTASNGTENVDRHRVSGDWEWKPAGGWLDRFLLTAFHQGSDNRTYTLQQRSATSSTCSLSSGAGYDCRLDMDFRFEQKSRGLGFQAEKSLDWGRAAHQIVAGADWREHEVSQLRDYLYTRTQISNGAVLQTRSLGSDNFPTNDFAPGSSTQLGMFIQDEISLLDGRLTVIPALRHDRVALKPDAAGLLSGTPQASQAPQFTAVEQSNAAFSPKLSALWQVTPAMVLYGQVVRGFRAPTYLEVNRLLLVSAQSTASIPNADLKPETSTGFEIGTRFKGLGGDLKVAAFDNRYRDFISNQKVCSSPAAPAPAACLGGLVRNAYQNVNLDKVRIYGTEVRGIWRLAGNLRADAALAWSRGDVTSTGEPLDSIEPVRLAAGLGWEGSALERPAGAEARLRAAARKSRVSSSSDIYLPGGYGVVDLFGWWQIHPKVRLNLAVNNLLDRKYWLWSDVRQSAVALNDPAPAFYTQPGRSLAASLVVDF